MCVSKNDYFGVVKAEGPELAQGERIRSLPCRGVKRCGFPQGRNNAARLRRAPNGGGKYRSKVLGRNNQLNPPCGTIQCNYSLSGRVTTSILVMAPGHDRRRPTSGGTQSATHSFAKLPHCVQVTWSLLPTLCGFHLVARRGLVGELTRFLKSLLRAKIEASLNVASDVTVANSVCHVICHAIFHILC